ncbi:SDR family NAD(P)-dependent oxidoreductase [Natrarchaeobius sp. A-rgal3]|uniref:SDR family NAD(P)-dependent oxidoreductase n=1 Tax=Natrarchaeobius versutus TaxID=1679078 RepID=UPI00350EDCBA
MSTPLTAQDVLVVGGASGIGRTVARTFADEGARVMIADIQEEPKSDGDPTHEVIAAAGGDASFVDIDLRDMASVQAAVDATVDEFGGIDTVFNSAGAMTRGRIEDTDEEAMEVVVDVNLVGPMRLAKASLPVLSEREGTLLNISSEAAERAVSDLPVYCASKGGVNQLTRQLAVEYGDEKVNINAIAPGTTKTAMNEEVRKNDPEWVDRRKDVIPIGKLNDPEDIANLATFLASEKGAKIHGTVVNIDGGTTAQ